MDGSLQLLGERVARRRELIQRELIERVDSRIQHTGV